MFDLITPIADLVAIAILALGLYYPRHRRMDLTMAYLTVNVGVLAVALALNSATVATGLGLGLFGVLAIIRLRSEELDQHEIAYYFASLSLGVIGGLGGSIGWLSIALLALVVAVVAVADLPGITSKYQSEQVVLDEAITDAARLHNRLEQLLGGEVVVATTRKVDLVNDLTIVDVRCMHTNHSRQLAQSVIS